VGFFNTDEGQMHVGRVAFASYVVLALVCLETESSAELGSVLITGAIGWWIAFCGKHPPRSWSEYGTSFRLRWGIQLAGVAPITATIRILLKHYSH
jgi:hypothetical protein